MSFRTLRLRPMLGAAFALACGISIAGLTAGCAKNSASSAEEPSQDRIAESDAEAVDEPETRGSSEELAAERAESTAPGDPTPPGGAQGGPDDGVSDADIEAFADAYLEVEKVQGDLEEQLQAAETNEEAQEIQQRAMAEIREAVESTGMPFEEYGRIAQDLQTDRELMETVEAVIEERRD